MSDQPRLPRAAGPPASPRWVVGLSSGVGLCVVSLVSKQNSASSTALERWSAGPLGQIPHFLGSLSKWEPPVPACSAGCPGVHAMDCYSLGLEVSCAVGAWGCQACGGWISAGLHTRSQEPLLPPLLSLSLGLAQVVLKSGLRSVSQVDPHPKVQGSPPPLRGEHPVRVVVAYGVGALT